MINLRGLGWTWEDGTVALDGVDLQVQTGEKVLITGPSGCGKSTLLRLIAGLLPVHGRGERRGLVQVHLGDPAEWSPLQRARHVGFVQQEPGDQLIASTVGEEVGFAGWQVGEEPLVERLLEQVGLQVPIHADPRALSGGQQQRLVIAAAMSAGAEVLLLDEPLAHLDAEGVAQLLEHLIGTVILVEHRLGAVLSWADRVIVLQEGRVVHDGGPPPVELLEGPGLVVPPMLRVERAGGLRVLGPVTPRWIRCPVDREVWTPAVIRGDVELLPAQSWRFGPGDRVALIGPNGVGKSSALEALAAALGPRAVWIPQDPSLSLFRGTVAEEVCYGPEERGVDPAIGLVDFGLQGQADRAPHRLSKGQQLRVAVAAGAAVAPEFLLLDEPTAGQHLDAVHSVMEAVDQAMGAGVLVFATHDVELALRFANWAIVIGGAQGPPSQVLRGLPLPPLQRAQAARGWLLADVDWQLAGPPGPVSTPVSEAKFRRIPHLERPFRRAPGFRDLVLLGAVGVLALLLDRPLSLGLLAGASLGFLFAQTISMATRLRVALGLFAIVWSTVLSQGLFYGDLPRVAWVSIGPVVLWREGLLWGWVQSFRLVSVAAIGIALAVRSSTHGLVGLLRSAWVPGPLAFLTALAVQAVPRVAQEWWIARTARARRGRALWRRSLWAWVHTELAMLLPVVRRSLLRGHHLAESLDTRGFDLNRLPAPTPLGRGDWVALGLAALVLSTVLGLQLLDALYSWELFYDPALRPLYSWVRLWL